jgi:biotin-(acetyl-CoA carboxylase) ligase
LRVHAQALLASALSKLEGLLDTLLREGFQPLQAAYLASWLHTGQQVTLLAPCMCMPTVA